VKLDLAKIERVKTQDADYMEAASDGKATTFSHERNIAFFDQDAAELTILMSKKRFSRERTPTAERRRLS
jgi:hypothetical protein